MAPGAALTLESEPGSSVEVALDGGLLRSTQGPVLAPAAGDHWLTVSARDRAGNAAAPRWIRLRVDAEPPRLHVSIAPEPVEQAGRRWLPSRARASATAQDDVAGLGSVTLRAGSLALTRENDRVEMELPSGGQWRLEASALDRVGNRSDAPPLSLSTDDTPPTAAIRLVGPRVEREGTTFVGPATSAEVELSDGESGFDRWEPLQDGAPASEAAWRGPWPAGHHVLSGTAWDRVGNATPLAALPVVVDSEPPRLEWSLSAAASVETPQGAIYRPPVRVKVSASDAGAGLALAEAWEGDQWRPLPPNREVASGGSGLRLQARDQVGNEALSEATWRVDSEAPRIELRDASGALSPGTRIEVQDGGALELHAFDDAGVLETRYQLGAGAWSPAPQLLRFVGTTESSLELVVEAEDRLGNRGRAEWEVVVREAPRP